MNALLALEPWRWTTIALGVAWKSAAVLGGAWVIVLSLRRSTAAARHFVWSLALSATLALAVLAIVLPSWSCPILPASVVEIGAGMRGDNGQPRRRQVTGSHSNGRMGCSALLIR